jgi:hypothetical protein
MLASILNAFEKTSVFNVILQKALPPPRATGDNSTNVQRAYITMAGLVLQNGEKFFLSEEFLLLAERAAETMPPEFVLAEEEFLSPIGALYLPRTTLLDGQPVDTLLWCTASTVGVVEQDPWNAIHFLYTNISAKVGAIHLLQSTGFLNKPLQSASSESKRLRLFAAIIHLMAQKLATIERQQSTSIGRTLAKRKGYVLPAEYRVVTLRRLQHSESEGSANRDYTCRWMVEEHWHKYRCGPDRKELRAVFVDSYIKGPAEKPFKPPSKKLFIARR